jgi:hypothetical protein
MSTKIRSGMWAWEKGYSSFLSSLGICWIQSSIWSILKEIPNPQDCPGAGGISSTFQASRTTYPIHKAVSKKSLNGYQMGNFGMNRIKQMICIPSLYET